MVELENQITVFVDFLGFREASVQLDTTRQQALLRLLHSIASMRSNFSIERKVEDNEQSIRIVPAISTFSDHVVLSYPLGEESADDVIPADVNASSELPRFVAAIAQLALPLGFLIRGGASLGKLYHKDGVVFGPAMVEAYELESRTAVYPRVILSPALSCVRAIKASTGHFYEKDFDGKIAVSYVREMIFRSGTPGDNWANEVNNWIERVAQTIEREVARLSEPGHERVRAKWIWFTKKLRHTIETDYFLKHKLTINTQRLASLAEIN